MPSDFFWDREAEHLEVSPSTVIYFILYVINYVIYFVLNESPFIIAELGLKQNRISLQGIMST